MSKRDKSPPLDDPRWVLLNKAFARRQNQTGSDKLALADLREMVLRAHTMRRSHDGTTRPEMLTPQFWRDFDYRLWGLNLSIGRSFPENTTLYVWGPNLEEIWPPEAPRAAAPPAATSDHPAADKLRQRPGTKYKDDWPEVVAQKLIYLALYDPDTLKNVDGLVPHVRKFLDDELGVGSPPKDPKTLRAKITFLLKLVRA